MSSREPMWYCHQCGAEMRPLMRPDPQCASCNSSFVEKMDNPTNDPREFYTGVDGIPGAPMNINPMDLFAQLFREDAPTGRGIPRTPSPTRDSSGSPGSPAGSRGSGRLQFTYEGPLGRRSIVMDGGSTRRRSAETPPRLSDYLRNNDNPRNGNDDDGPIPGDLMAHYLMTLFGQLGARGGSPFIGPLGMFGPGGEGLGDGRYGDYVFSQEALDQIITQIMEGSNANRPVPATEEVVDNLPRDVLEAGSPLLEQDCAVCKDQFSLQTEDEGEQVVVTLPCKHPFHEGCILPWLKSSGTCPVCRYALVPQPNGHAHGAGPSGPSSSSSPDRDRSSESEGSSGPSSSSPSREHVPNSSSLSRPYSRSSAAGVQDHQPSMRERLFGALYPYTHHDERHREGEERRGTSSGSRREGSGNRRHSPPSRRGSENRRDDMPNLPGSFNG